VVPQSPTGVDGSADHDYVAGGDRTMSERYTLGERLAICHELLMRARCLIDSKEHPDWDQAAYAETSRCNRLADRIQALTEVLESCLAALTVRYDANIGADLVAQIREVLAAEATEKEKVE
jgi:hypothetical protein